MTQSFNHTAELSIPVAMPVKEAKTEIKTKPVIVETKKSEYSM